MTVAPEGNRVWMLQQQELVYDAPLFSLLHQPLL
jgi:hypothetical protein